MTKGNECYPLTSDEDFNTATADSTKPLSDSIGEGIIVRYPSINVNGNTHEIILNLYCLDGPSQPAKWDKHSTKSTLVYDNTNNKVTLTLYGWSYQGCDMDGYTALNNHSAGTLLTYWI